MYFVNAGSGVGRSIIWGANIHIFVFTDLKKQSISKEVNNAEHEYMNIAPPPPPPNYRSSYATECWN